MSDDINVHMSFLGVPRFETGDGIRIQVTSKKGVALLAALATAERFERSRGWLQQLLWGSRDQKQAQSSLRRELSNLRAIFSKHGLDILRCNHHGVELIMTNIYIDILKDTGRNSHRQFCEGLDLAREDEFEDWLRDMRNHFEDMEATLRKDRQWGSRHESDQQLIPGKSLSLAVARA